MLLAGATGTASLSFTKRHDVIIYLNRHNPRRAGKGINIIGILYHIIIVGILFLSGVRPV